MKQLTRRYFIQTSALALGSVGIAGLASACGSKNGKRKAFKYALCSEIVKEFSWQEQCSIIGNAGYEGVEIAPFTLVKEGVDEITAGDRQQMVQHMKDAGIVCAGLHWLFVPPPQGLHFTTPDSALREKSIGYLDKLIDFCGDMGGEVMVFGSPAQRGTSQGISIIDATSYFAEGLAKVADHAKDRNVTILVESLPKSQTDVVNTLEEAMQVVNRIGHPNISTMFDFHNAEDETESLTGLIQKHIKDIRHMHIQNMDGTLIIPDKIPQDIIDIFGTLKKLDYNKWISIEVFDFTPGGKFIAEEGMKTFLAIEARM